MKNTVAIFVFLFTILSKLTAQENNPPKPIPKAWGVNVSPYLFNEFGEEYYTINITRESKKNFLSVGLIVPIGAHLEYMYFPNGTLRRFNLFFSYNMIYSSFIFYSYRYPNYFISKREYRVVNALGYGFRLNFNSSIYAETSLNVGIMEMERGSQDMVYIFKIGIGYQFRPSTGKGKIYLLNED